MDAQLRNQIDTLRGDIDLTQRAARGLMHDPALEITHGATSAADVSARAEAKANLMLAVRHLEDARMRLGKVCQALDGGTSCYDKPNTPPEK